MTPTLDGKIDPEEWDELYSADGMTAYMEYEPGKYHFAAVMPTGKDLIVSLDLKSDGWLIGDDNVEVRVHMQDGKPTIHVRELDASRKEGPVWIENPGFSLSSMAAVATADGKDTVELTLIDPGTNTINPRPGLHPAVRFDVVPPDAPMVEAYLPRVLTQVQLVAERSTALPETLKWTADTRGRVIAPGESTRIRQTFNGTNDLGARRIAMRGFGLAKDVINVVEKPFPAFDDKKRAFVDYDTAVQKDATPGYRVLRSVMTFEKGPEATLETSFRVAPVLECSINPTDIRAGETPQVGRIPLFIKSNTDRRLEGNYHVILPTEFTIKSGGDGNFTIYDRRGTIRRNLDVILPKINAGTYPIQFTAVIGAKTFTQTLYVTVFEPEK